MLITILIGLVVLSVIIIVHELGHLITAKASRVRVDEFGLGFPPRLLSVRWGETRYSLNAVPLGGFVKMAGEEDPKVPGSLASKSIGTRLLILSAGSVMNLLLPLLLFSVAFMVPHNLEIGQVVVEEVASNSPAATAGIKPGDIIVSINDKPVRNIGDLHRYIHLNLGKEVTIVTSRDGLKKEAQLTPRERPPEGQGAIGVLVKTTDIAIVRQHYPFWQAIPMGVGEYMKALVLLKSGIISLIVGEVPADEVTLVGVVQMTGEVAKVGISPLLEITALISLILGIGNLLPLPALDGGRIVFVLLEWVRRGRRVAPKTEGLIHLIGFALLMGLTLAIIGWDIIRMVRGEGLIP
ncbi:M50 family metallopeptidase [Dehalococcoidales bacterium]|nr:M50 family metallopeptidase [Dehalococcoidales bacterium]